MLAFGAAGCGSGETDAADAEPTVEAAPTTVPEGDDGPHEAVAWGVMRGQEPHPTEPATAAKLAAFAEPTKPSDSFSGTQAPSDLDKGMPEGLRSGRELFARSRLLIPAADAEGFRLYGVPTENGWVCLHLLEPSEPLEGTSVGGCTRNLTEGIDYAMSGNGDSFRVYGLVADDVSGVEILANGKPYPAILGRNAFFFQADPKEVCPTELTALLVEGDKGPGHELEVYAPSGAESDEAEREKYFGCR